MSDLRSVSARMLGPANTPSGIGFLVIGLIDAIGTGMYLAGSALFFTIHVGLSVAQVGLGLSIAGAVGLIAQPLVGKIVDWVGAKRALAAINLYRAAGFAAYAFVDDFATFLVIASLLGLAELGIPAIYQALAEEIAGPAERMPVMARLRVGFNVGFTLGGLAASLSIAIGTRGSYIAVVLVNALSFLVAALLLTRLRLAHPRTTQPPSGRRFALSALADRGFMSIAAVNGLLALHMTLLAVGVPIWISEHTAAPTSVVGLVLVVNTIMVVLLQVKVSKGTDGVEGGTRALQWAGLWLAASCGLLALAGAVTNAVAVVGVLFLAVAALTMGELYQSVGGWGLSYALAPEQSRVEYLATFNLGVSAQSVVGPLLVTAAVIANGVVGWIVLAVAILVLVMLVRPAMLRGRSSAASPGVR